MRYERNCIICGTRYQYCGNCSDFAGVPTWKYIYDTENCRDIFKTIESYKEGNIDAKTASDKLSMFDVNISSKVILEDCARIHAEASELSDEIVESKNKKIKSKYAVND